MASLIEALDIKRKMYFEYEGAPYHCLDVEVSRPTARGGQTLVRLKMRNLITRAVFDKTFKARRSACTPRHGSSPEGPKQVLGSWFWVLGSERAPGTLQAQEFFHARDQRLHRVRCDDGKRVRVAMAIELVAARRGGLRDAVE